MLPRVIEWKDDGLYLLDQRKIPMEVAFRRCDTADDVAEAIVKMVVRGAPAIGVAAAYGVVLASREGTRSSLVCAMERLACTRPTAVNLFWALKRMKSVAESVPDENLYARLLDEASSIQSEDLNSNMRMGRHGQELLPDDVRVLTHCNAGALATAGYGTALGVIRAAREAGKKITVYADETRPVFQGARLTAWELYQDGFDVTVICDNMAASLMRSGKVDAVIVGADRIAANGDVANKIGTYGLAVLCSVHKIPFYVAAPTNTIDISLGDGGQIPIEQRDPAEVRTPGGRKLIPEYIPVWNPAFDVTPAEYVSAIITEDGVLRHPCRESISACLGSHKK